MNNITDSLLWKDTPEEILFKANLLKEVIKGKYDQVANIPFSTKSFHPIVHHINDIDYEFAKSREILDFYRYVHPDKFVRDASDAASKLLSEFEIECTVKEEIFNRFVHIRNEADFDSNWSKNDKRFVQSVIRFGKQNGMHLAEPRRKNIKTLELRILEACNKFLYNLHNDYSYLTLTAYDLEGLPKEFIASLEKESNLHYRVMLNYYHYFPIMSKCKVANTRKLMETAFNSRCKMENAALLTELINLRHKKANLMGFENHASFVLQSCMSKHPDQVYEFLSNMKEHLIPLGRQTLRTMLNLKQVDCNNNEEKFDGKINMWDIRYYNTMLEEMSYPLDKGRLREYFPLDVVLKGLFKLTQDLLQIKFEKVPKPSVWHKDVTMYSVADKNGGVPIGHFYLDLVFRPGKYKHISSFCIVPSRWNADGARQNAVTAMTANFMKHSHAGAPLLLHDEVVTMFHEFGQMMQYLCVETEHEMFSRTSLEREFIGVPSQVFENWCWEVKPLQIISRHYKDHSVLPLSTIGALVKARNANGALYWLRQVLLSTLDLNVHTNPTIDVAEDYNNLCQELLGIPATKGTFMPATFLHLVIGYDAFYYSYLWSKVYSFDMFYSRFKMAGLANLQVAKDFREKILSPGGGVDAFTKFQNFMGRAPSSDSFLQFLSMDDEALDQYLYQQPISDLIVSDQETDDPDESSPLQGTAVSPTDKTDDTSARRSLFRKIASLQNVFQPFAKTRAADPSHSLLSGQAPPH